MVTQTKHNVEVMHIEIFAYPHKSKDMQYNIIIRQHFFPVMSNESLKFNVDGSLRGNPGPAGIGEVLRDSRGKIICLFSLYKGIFDSNLMELLAIKKACCLCVMNPLLASISIETVSDSKVVVSWINDEGIGCLAHVKDVYDCREFMRIHGGISVFFNSRSSNSFADFLAKKVSSQSGNMVQWSD
ncbi:hypothetical protein Ddye_026450 [Dipteronia dyeriana]|uniref:RNase H type-1 domain-containing protein n=1 Tax=Dipteronia dyeriana TaxID=168575 RepID=A0AAD9WQJ7_9ROSI|nr:hypothetical protein Ddye_026450 [Dipteronia dyeriana]